MATKARDKQHELLAKIEAMQAEQARAEANRLELAALYEEARSLASDAESIVDSGAGKPADEKAFRESVEAIKAKDVSVDLTAFELEMQKEMKRLQDKMHRKVRAVTAGMSPKQLMDREKSDDALGRLKAKGLLHPEYEKGSAKIQVRLPMAWREALVQTAKDRKTSQSELIRQGLKLVFDKQLADDLDEVYPGKRLS